MQVETYSANEFRSLLLQAVEQTRAVAQREVAESLPPDTLFVLDAFAQGHRVSSVDEVFAWLYRDGAFPRLVVMGVRGIVEDKTLVAVIPSGHTYVRDRTLTLNHPPEMGPFNCVGLMPSYQVWQRARPLTRHDLEEAAAHWQAHRTS
jgi:hypothetical protein